jgi:hypothetical protein
MYFPLKFDLRERVKHLPAGLPNSINRSIKITNLISTRITDPHPSYHGPSRRMDRLAHRGRGRWSPNWVHSAPRHLLAYCACPGWLWGWRIFGGMNNGRGNPSTRRKPAPAPLCPRQIPLDKTRDRTRATAVGSQRLTAWAMARPSDRLSRL